MSKFKQPKNTEIRELAPNPSLRRLMDSGKIPSEARFFQAGRCKILLVPPYNGKGWYANFAREDRFPLVEEVQSIAVFIIPVGIKVTLRFEEEKNADGSYHAELREERTTEPFPLAPEPDQPELN